MRIRTFVVAALAAALSACSALAMGSWDVVRGNGAIRVESREVSAFTGIENQGSGLVRFSQGPSRQVTVETDENILPFLETEVRDGVLVLRCRPGSSIDPTRLVFRITSPDLRSAVVEGSGGIRLETPLATDRLEIGIEGSGSFEGKATVDAAAVRIAGSGSVSLTGSARAARFQIEGSGGVDAADFASIDAHVVIRGSGGVSLLATGTLDVEILGSGDVRYRGGAKLTVRDAGSGSVREL